MTRFRFFLPSSWFVAILREVAVLPLFCVFRYSGIVCGILWDEYSNLRLELISRQLLNGADQFLGKLSNLLIQCLPEYVPIGVGSN